MTKILIIDDDEAVRDMLSDFLFSESYEVELARNGREGLELLKETVVDLIILDVFMPELDGLELIQELNKEKEHPPIITISGGGGILPPKWSGKLTEVYRVARSLTKPIDVQFFLDTVKQTLRSTEPVDKLA